VLFRSGGNLAMDELSNRFAGLNEEITAALN